MSQEVYQIEGNWREVLHRTAASEITASLKIVVQGGALVRNTNGSRAARIIRNVCVCARAFSWNWGRNSQQICIDLTQEFRMKTVKNIESGTHGECQQNVLWSHEFWPSLVLLCLAKNISEKHAAFASWSRSHGVTTQNTASKYHRHDNLNN